MSVLSLSEAQTEKAVAILEGMDDGSIRTPQDIVPWWKNAISWGDINRTVEYDVYENMDSSDEVRKWISTEDIQGLAGPTADNSWQTRAEDMKAVRMVNILEIMLEGEFRLDYEDPPVFIEFDDQYYLDTDGRHRTLALLALEVDEFMATVIEVPTTL